MYGLRVDRASDGVVYLTGDLDRDSTRDLEARVAEHLDGDDRVVLDLQNVVSWDTIGISAFLRLAKRIAPGRVVLRSLPPNLAVVLDIVSLEEFAISPDGGSRDRIVEVRVRARETRTDGPGAVSRWAAFRGTFDAATLATRRLAARFADLRARSLEVWGTSRSVRDQAVAMRSGS